jgi:hypothetical protein
MNRTELLALAERLEAASGPDRELDARIWCALNDKRYADHNKAYAPYGGANPLTQVEYTEPPKRSRMVTGDRDHALPVTSSIDAALTLVPSPTADGKFTYALGDCHDDEYDAWACVTAPPDDCTDYSAHAVTTALALTAACLRARAQQDDHTLVRGRE